MLRNLIARWLDGWRCEPDPATLDPDTPDDDDGPDDEPLPDDATEEDEAAVAARYAQRREHAIAAGLVLAGGLDGFEAVYAVQGMILAGMHHDAVRQAWGDKLN